MSTVGGTAYLEHSVIGDGCCHNTGSRAGDDKDSEKELSFVEHDEVERREVWGVGSTSDSMAT